MVQGLPDWTKGIAVNVTAESAEYPTTIGTRPLGTIIVHETVTPFSLGDEILSYTPPAGFRFYLAKANVFANRSNYEGWIRTWIGDQDLGERHILFWVPSVIEYPFDVFLDGDGTKKVKITVRWSGLASEWETTIFGELVKL